MDVFFFVDCLLAFWRIIDWDVDGKSLVRSSLRKEKVYEFFVPISFRDAYSHFITSVKSFLSVKLFGAFRIFFS